MNQNFRPNRPIAQIRLLYFVLLVVILFGLLFIAIDRIAPWRYIWVITVALGVLVCLIAMVLVPLYYRHIQYGADRDGLYSVQGLWFLSRRRISFSAIRAVRVVSGPLERHYGLSTVIVSATGTGMILDGLSADQTQALLHRLS